LPDLVKPVFDIFTQDTGIKVNFIFLKQGALERLKSEGEFTPADLILVADIGSIQDIVDADLVSPIKSPAVKDNIPAQYRSPDDLWVGLTGRIRMIARTTKDLTIDIHGYDALSNPKLKGRVCSRALTHPYNVSLVASYLHEHGIESTQKWLTDFRKNIFDKPSGDDTGQIDLIASGLCDIAPVNHYYYERMIALDKNLAKKVKLVPLSEMTDGVYANVSGVLVSKYAANYDNAIKLIEFMTQPKAQKVFADYDYEFPLNAQVVHKSNMFKKGIENIKSLPLDAIAHNREKALEIIYKIQ
jgi:iron(III) transport system substrate-binding protein